MYMHVYKNVHTQFYNKSLSNFGQTVLAAKCINDPVLCLYVLYGVCTSACYNSPKHANRPQTCVVTW